MVVGLATDRCGGRIRSPARRRMCGGRQPRAARPESTAAPKIHISSAPMPGTPSRSRAHSDRSACPLRSPSRACCSLPAAPASRRCDRCCGRCWTARRDRPTLIYSARAPEEFAFLEEWTRLASKGRDLYLTVTQRGRWHVERLARPDRRQGASRPPSRRRRPAASCAARRHGQRHGALAARRGRARQLIQWEAE